MASRSGMFFSQRSSWAGSETPMPDPGPMFRETMHLTFPDPAGRIDLKAGTLAPAGIEMWWVRSTGHEIHLREPGKATYLVPLRGRIESATTRTELRAGPGGSLLFSPNVRRTRVVPDGGRYEALALLVPDRSLLEALLPDRCAVPPVEAAFPTPSASPVEATLRSLVVWLVGELSREATPLCEARRQAHLGTLVLDLVGQIFGEEADAALGSPGAPAAGLRRVEEAEEIMRAAAGEPLAIGDLAARVGVSQRALQAAFREHRGATPRAALQRIRLEEARRRLLFAGEEDTVTTVALDLGFAHLGRFALTYRIAFGESPSETLRRRTSRPHGHRRSAPAAQPAPRAPS